PYTATATPSISTLSLHDALPISLAVSGRTIPPAVVSLASSRSTTTRSPNGLSVIDPVSCSVSVASINPRRWGFLNGARRRQNPRSEEHTSELQSRGHLVCRLLLG